MNTPASPTPVTQFGVFELDLRSRELRKQGMKVRLQGQPVEILVILLERPREIVTREELQKKLWPADTFVDFEQGLNNAMKRLRAALDENAETPRFIETVPRRGYRFIGAVNRNGQTLAADTGTPALQVKPWRRSALSLLPASIAVVALALWWVSTIEPAPPKITSTVQLTIDGRVKCDGPIATDGVRVYFSEVFDDGCRVMAVSVSGGQSVLIHTPFPDTHVLNISRDMSELLVSDGDLDADRPLWVVPTLGGSPRRLGDVVAHDGSWSSNGQKFVYANGSALYLTNGDGTEPRLLVSASSNPVVWAWQPVWSLDGKRVRFQLYDGSKHVGSLWEITSEGQDMHPLFPGWQDPPMQCCGSRTPDGRYYLFFSWKNLPRSSSFPAPDIWAVRERHGLLCKPSRSPVQLTAGPLHFSNLVSSLDGKVLFAVSNSNRGELMRYDRKTQQLFPYPTGISAEGVNFSKDGAWMTYVTWPQGQLWRSRSDGSEALQLTFAPLRAYDPHWSPDGKQIAYSGINPGGEWQIYLVSRDGSTSQRLLADQTAGTDPTWSPDGDSIMFGQPPLRDNATVHDVLRIFNVKSGRTSVVPGSEGLRSPRFSPDGRYISALSARDAKLMLLDVARQTWTAQGQKHTGWQCWSKDSKFVYFLMEDGEPGVFRVSVDNNKLERILSLKDFREAGTWGAWLSLTPEEDPLVLRDVGPPEIYALSWDAP